MGEWSNPPKEFIELHGAIQHLLIDYKPEEINGRKACLMINFLTKEIRTREIDKYSVYLEIAAWAIIAAQKEEER